MAGRDAIQSRMVRVPAGPFLSGVERRPMELGEFWIDRYPVTNEGYARTVPEHRFTPHRARHPAVWVRWEDARGYARSLGFDLPTREEWEKAARGTDGRLYPWGDDYDPRRFNVLESDLGDTTPVDRYGNLGASPWGACDLAGNVWEWTLTEVPGGPRAGEKIVLGGSFEWSWFELQDGVFSPDSRPPGEGYPTVGFRCVSRP